MPIRLNIDRTNNITTFTLQGEITLSELIEAINSYGRSGVTLNELYDVRQLTGERISSTDITKVVNYFQKYAGVRPEKSKTAVLVAESIDFGLSRMIQALTEDVVPFSINIFKSRDLALAWLHGKSS